MKGLGWFWCFMFVECYSNGFLKAAPTSLLFLCGFSYLEDIVFGFVLVLIVDLWGNKSLSWS